MAPAPPVVHHGCAENAGRDQPLDRIGDENGSDGGRQQDDGRQHDLVEAIAVHRAHPDRVLRRQGEAGFGDHRRDFIHLAERHRFVIGCPAVAREADNLEAVPAEQAAQEARLHPQGLHAVHRHDEVGAGEEAAAAAQALGRAVEPEIPFTQRGADDAGGKADKREAGERHDEADHLCQRAQPCEPLARTGQPLLPAVDVPQVERQEEFELLRETADHRHYGEREFEQAEGQHPLAVHCEQRRSFRQGFGGNGICHGRRFTFAALAYQFAQALALRFGQIG